MREEIFLRFLQSGRIRIHYLDSSLERCSFRLVGGEEWLLSYLHGFPHLTTVEGIADRHENSTYYYSSDPTKCPDNYPHLQNFQGNGFFAKTFYLEKHLYIDLWGGPGDYHVKLREASLLLYDLAAVYTNWKRLT